MNTEQRDWIKTRDVDKRKKRFERKLREKGFDSKLKELQARNSLYLAQLKTKSTKAEILFGDFLSESKIPFRFQKGFFIPFHRIVDFYIPKKHIIIEIDGGYHTVSDISKKDYMKDVLWNKRGFTTIRFTNEEIFDDSFKEKIMELYSRLR